MMQGIFRWGTREFHCLNRQRVRHNVVTTKNSASTFSTARRLTRSPEDSTTLLFVHSNRRYSPALIFVNSRRYFSAEEAISSEPINEEERSVEEQYSRKTPLEHILLRPGMYVGPNEKLPPSPVWVLDPLPPFETKQKETTENIQLQMTRKEYSLVPALGKVFDEILVNASDNRLRHPRSCTRIDVIIHPGTNDGVTTPCVQIFNDGKGIPVQVHRKEQMYVPEMLFGHLLTGSNFDDSEKRITGGRHGYGAKLTNIFSKSFNVEIIDSKKRLRYTQTWTDNMTQASPPEIVSIPKGIPDSTCITFVPDLPRLTGDPYCNTIPMEDYAVMCRRVVDVAGCTAGKLQVTLNGRNVSMPSFQEYMQLYRRSPSAPPIKFTTINSRLTLGIGLSESGSFDSVSFVNGMATTRGGTHVNTIVQQVTKAIQEKIGKTDAELANALSSSIIRRHLFVAVDALIENPTFDSQMKEYLTSSPTNFGSSWVLTEKFLKSLVQSEGDGGPGIVEEVLRVLKGRQQATLLKTANGKKSKRQLLSIPKLEDAHQAGSNNGYECTLILTEGDSAKALAVAGLEVIGRERYGVFPLRGKFLNVRDASVSQLSSNAEVKALCAIIGLDFKKEYDTVAERRNLRYGRVMLMTDQDTDGSHIKGLVLNFFRHFWPNLLMPPGDAASEEKSEHHRFFSSFVTPLLKASQKRGKKEKVAFFSMSEYLKWRESIGEEEAKQWTIKYYKGLGTSTPVEAKEYFLAFDKHYRPFRWNSNSDGEILDLVFDKKRTADRKEWILTTYDESASVLLDPNYGFSVSYEDFINKEMIHFSHADNIRSIPSVIDGLKPSQRKVLYACFKRKLKDEIKVAQLTGYCAEHTAYHHGEASLQATIIGMAQDFVGSNNINLLEPVGQFGTRLVGGSDAASPRYIFTQLSPIARYLFPEGDDVLLRYREDDGQVIEPEFYCPIIPLLVVNGSQGIGTGWSTFIPPHNAMDVVDYIRAKLDKQQILPKVRPYARGFEGKIEDRVNDDGYVTFGRVSIVNDTTVLIDELPLRTWTNNYKEHLIAMRDREEITGFVENHTTTKVSFLVSLNRAQLERLISIGLEKGFKLTSNLPITNMHAFDARHQMKRFASAESMVEEFFPVRENLYHDRKSVLESEANYAANLMLNKANFIQQVTSGSVDLLSGKKTREEMTKILREMGFASYASLTEIRNDNAVSKRHYSKTSDEKDEAPDYDYLLNMPLKNLTVENIEELRNEASTKEKVLKQIRSTSPLDLWREDLEALIPYLNT